MDVPPVVSVEAAPCSSDNSSRGSIGSKWRLGTAYFPREEVQYLTTTLILTMIIIISLVNLCLENGTESFWASLVSGCVGAILPHPKIVKKPNTSR